MNNSEYVLQPWTKNIGLKLQSILISGMRGPDFRNESIKDCICWMRTNVMIDADPKKQSYMKSVYMSDTIIKNTINELQYAIVHYVHHFADAFMVMACFHNDLKVKKFSLLLYKLIAEELFHFHPETKNEFIKRHIDKI
jgi:hypothetical protein